MHARKPRMFTIGTESRAERDVIAKEVAEKAGQPSLML